MLAIAGGLVVLALAVMLHLHLEHRADDLQQNGTPVTGEVVAVDKTSKSCAVEVWFRYAGMDRQERLRCDRRAPAPRKGEELPVLVDPDDPAHVALKGHDNESGVSGFVAFALLVMGLGSVVLAIGVLINNRYLHRYLSAGPWRRLQVQWLGQPVSTVIVEDGETEHRLKVTYILGPLPPSLECIREADVVGEIPGKVLLRPVGTDHLVIVRPRT